MKYYQTLLSGPTLAGTKNAEILEGSASGTVFAYQADGTWVNTRAQCVGDPAGAGPNTLISIDGYGRNNDIFKGKAGTANTLVMGDGKVALFLDDPYSANGNQARIQNIQEIVCGDGGQIVDLTSTRFAYGNVKILGGADADYLWSNAGHDTMNGLGGNDDMWGGSGNDDMAGGTGNDKVVGGSGNDTVRGGQHNDTVSGGAGNDSVYGDTGNDVAAGDDGNDYVSGGDGSDTVNGNAGDDKLAGGKGADLVHGGDGADKLNGNTGSDTLDGGAGNDRVFGDAGNDSIAGGGDSDTLYGNTGNDTILGGAGNDTLYGNKGNDVMTGGAGADRFVWLANENYSTATGVTDTDRITDFGKNDVLDFSALISNGSDTDAGHFVKFQDMAAGTMVLVANVPGGEFHETVMLDGLHGLSVAKAQADGWLLI